MEELLKANAPFIWNQECLDAFKTLKRKLVKALILIFLNWSIKFHVHIDASAIVIGTILAQPSEDNMDHPVAYASRKPNKVENNYSMME